jgi:hypothetical protein
MVRGGESVDLVDEDLPVVGVERGAIGDDERMTQQLHDTALIVREVAKFHVEITRGVTSKDAEEAFSEVRQCREPP